MSEIGDLITFMFSDIKDCCSSIREMTVNPSVGVAQIIQKNEVESKLFLSSTDNGYVDVFFRNSDICEPLW